MEHLVCQEKCKELRVVIFCNTFRLLAQLYLMQIEVAGAAKYFAKLGVSLGFRKLRSYRATSEDFKFDHKARNTLDLFL